MPWFDKKSFQTVTTVSALKDWHRKLDAATSICVDTETTGLDLLTVDLVGIPLAVHNPSTDEIEACYIPVGHTSKACHGGKQLPLKTVLAILKPHLEGPKPKIFHNALYDLAMFQRYGVQVQSVHDTMAMAYTLLGASDSRGVGMDNLAKRFLKYTTLKFEDMVRPELGHTTFADVQIHHATTYAAEDSAVTLLLAKVFQKLLVNAGLWTVYDEIDRPLLPALTAMKMTGAKVDADRLAALKEPWQKLADAAAQRAYKIIGREFNVGSAKQLGGILYDELKLPVKRYTDSGSPSTDKTALEMTDHPLVEAVLESRKFTKLISTYCDGLTGHVHKSTGRVHTNFNSCFTNTRRFSSSGPNLQNIPTRTEEGKEIRDAFVADKGNVLVCCDKSQIEYRILAHVTQAERLLEAFRNGQDLHATMAALVKGGDWQDYADKKDRERYKLRTIFKNVNFATIYGAGPAKVAYMSEIDVDEAYYLLDMHRDLAPEVYTWKDDVKVFGKAHGYIETIFGSRVYVPNIKSRDLSLQGYGERQAVNAVIQGAAADDMRLAVTKVYDALVAEVPTAHVLLQVHDELVVECRKRDADKVAALMKHHMERCADDFVDWSIPIVAEVGIGSTWKTAKDD